MRWLVTLILAIIPSLKRGPCVANKNARTNACGMTTVKQNIHNLNQMRANKKGYSLSLILISHIDNPLYSDCEIVDADLQQFNFKAATLQFLPGQAFDLLESLPICKGIESQHFIQWTSLVVWIVNLFHQQHETRVGAGGQLYLLRT